MKNYTEYSCAFEVDNNDGDNIKLDNNIDQIIKNSFNNQNGPRLSNLKNGLYIVATPIGNLGDITLRALNVLRNVDVILSEDTRETNKLLVAYGIHKPLYRADEHSHLNYSKIFQKFGKIAFVSDRGLPNFSDPGAKVINVYLSIYSYDNIFLIPGPSSFEAISLLPFLPHPFVFLGFVKKLNKIKNYDCNVLLLESCHRINKTLNKLMEFEWEQIYVFHELTKKFEKIWVIKPNTEMTELPRKGEYVIFIKKNIKQKHKVDKYAHLKNLKKS